MKNNIEIPGIKRDLNRDLFLSPSNTPIMNKSIDIINITKERTLITSIIKKEGHFAPLKILSYF